MNLADTLGSVSKAIAGGLLAGATGGLIPAVLSTAATSVADPSNPANPISIPAGLNMPWWGYVLVGVGNAVIGFIGVYYAPKNTPVTVAKNGK